MAAQEVGVSAREAEVLAAIGEHLTNAEIAARLFISVRTVESHVSSMLRKLQVEDRRALAALAARLPAADPGETGKIMVPLPAPLTSFVGRSAERAALTSVVRGHRMVNAVGPGGVGKTRLVLSVLTGLAGEFADGVWFVDLVPIAHPSMIAPAIAAALGLGEDEARSAEDTVADWLAVRETLLVLDNCEHLLDGVAVVVERLLAGCPRLRVLITSRARLRVAYEWVFPVPGLSLAADGGGPGDAVALFCQRAGAGGAELGPADQDRVAVICRKLEGIALAIELAAARVTSLGLDDLEAGLADRLRLLTGGSRVADRHRSLQSTLDWSYALLDETSQAVLRRVSVFAAPFTAAAVGAVASGWPPVPGGLLHAVLAGLVDQSLLVAAPGDGATRYRVPETIRQYGAGRLAEAGEQDEAHVRHLRWFLGEAAAPDLPGGRGLGAWRVAFDLAADELRAALGWAAGHTGHRGVAYQLAVRLAELSFARGLPGEAQDRYEQAAELAGADRDAAAALRGAAGAAEFRYQGDDALRLRRAAAGRALRAGDQAGAAADLARAAELITRLPGLWDTPPAVTAADQLIADARALGPDSPAAEARILAAEGFRCPETDPAVASLAERALVSARQAGDVLAESSALDLMTSIQLVRGEVRAAAASSWRRTELLAPLRPRADMGFEFPDALMMAEECALAAGELPKARALAERLADLPFHHEGGHQAACRLIVVAALAGDWDEALLRAGRFREEWELAGRPHGTSWARASAGSVARGSYTAATIHGLRGDQAERDAWLEVADAMTVPGKPWRGRRFGQFLDAWLLLHQGRAEEAGQVLDAAPEPDGLAWQNGMWQPWCAALWAEAAVLAGRGDAAARIAAAQEMTRDNRAASAIVGRAAALPGDRAGLRRAAAALQAAGFRYQWARTLVFLGGEDRERGESVLAGLGAAAMAWPPAG
ncbi:MAG TPA: LuxR C-terminal-related transcriptional regulator [Streptosporangiaceae bacterium]